MSNTATYNDLNLILHHLASDIGSGRIEFQIDNTCDLGFVASWPRYGRTQASVMVEGDPETGLIAITFKSKSREARVTNLTIRGEAREYMTAVWDSLMNQFYDHVNGEATFDICVALGRLDD